MAKLLMTATVAVAGLQVSRIFEQMILGAFIFQVLKAACVQVTGWRRGRQLDLISFLAWDAVCNGVKFDGSMVSRKGAGPYKRAGPGRQVELCARLAYASELGSEAPGQFAC